MHSVILFALLSLGLVWTQLLVDCMIMSAGIVSQLILGSFDPTVVGVIMLRDFLGYMSWRWSVLRLLFSS